VEDNKRYLRLAAIQMVSSSNMQSNLRTAKKLMSEAVNQGAQMVVLPENFAVFGQRNVLDCGQAEATQKGPIRSFLRQMASELGIWLIGGTVPTVEPHPQREVSIHSLANPESLKGRVYAACYLINPVGAEIGRYDKIHLFDVDMGEKYGRYRESDSFQRGVRPCVVETPWGRVGVAVCYDIRFPEYFRLLMDRGAEMVVVPSAFTYSTGEAHWEVLMRARAIENLCFIAGASQGGEHENNRRTWGGSVVVNPWGQVLASHNTGEGIVIADIDFEEVQQARAKMPVHTHRQFSVN
jgi:deaminated glutathione amidase